MKADEAFFKFGRGDELKDIITGFTGIVRGRSDYLTGCNTYGLQSTKLDKDGNPDKWKWFDEHQLKLVKKEKVKLPQQEKNQKLGGPISDDHFPPQ